MCIVELPVFNYSAEFCYFTQLHKRYELTRAGEGSITLHAAIGIRRLRADASQDPQEQQREIRETNKNF